MSNKENQKLAQDEEVDGPTKMVNGGYLLLSLGLATLSALVLFQLAKCCGCWLCVSTICV